MGDLRKAVEAEIAKTVGTELNVSRQHQPNSNVPRSKEIGYSAGVYVPSVYLYADMIGSSALVRQHPTETAARVFKAFLQVAVRIIRSHDGHIRSFDGDRVMGVFSGDDRAARAVKVSMQVKWACSELLQPSLHARFKSFRSFRSFKSFKSFKSSGWRLRCAVGIANGESLLIHAGIRDSDDLVSIGRNANLAAKLSDLRQSSYTTFIGAGAHGELTDPTLNSKGVPMWDGPYSIDLGGEQRKYYRSSFRWRIS